MPFCCARPAQHACSQEGAGAASTTPQASAGSAGSSPPCKTTKQYKLVDRPNLSLSEPGPFLFVPGWPCGSGRAVRVWNGLAGPRRPLRARKAMGPERALRARRNGPGFGRDKLVGSYMTEGPKYPVSHPEVAFQLERPGVSTPNASPIAARNKMLEQKTKGILMFLATSVDEIWAH